MHRMRIAIGILACVLLASACSSKKHSAPGEQSDSSTGPAGQPDSGGLDAANTAADGGATTMVGASDAGSLQPITTPVDQWTWLPIEGAHCANGTPTGIGINRSTMSNDLVIMFEGGGACWDATTCITTPAAVHLQDTYDATLFQSDFVAKQSPTQRDPQNPLSTATSVFIPYCTGDLHAGDKVRSYTAGSVTREVHHVGALNVDAALARLRNGLPQPNTVWLIGSSAGGYGAQLNMQPVVNAFAHPPQVHVLADSSPLVTPADARWTAWKSQWHMRMPTPCNNCDTRFGAVIDALASQYAGSRIGLLEYAQDATIAQYFGFDGPTLSMQLDALVRQSYQRDNTHSFIAPGNAHVMLGNVATQKSADGTALSTWLTAWILGLPTWQNAH